MSKEFSFRQRVGSLNWKVVSSVHLEDIILNLKISELQGVLDDVTFCSFTAADVKGNTVESITKLVQLMQLICEYLLHSQEAQFKLIKDINNKGNRLKDTVEKLRIENVKLKEDSKIYQRQLAMLRKSLNKSGPGGLSDSYNDRLDDNGSGNMRGSPQLVGTLLEHERETRTYMLSLLEEQRRTFTAEMSTLAEALRDRSSSNNGSAAAFNTERWMSGFAQQMEDICATAIRKTSADESKIGKDSRTNATDSRRRRSADKVVEFDTDTDYHSNEGRISDILRSAALETQAEQLTKLQRELSDRESAVRARELEVARSSSMQKQSILAGAASSNNTALQLQVSASKSVSMIQQCKMLAARSLRSKIQQLSWRRQSQAFLRWVVETHERREREDQEQQSRVLSVSSRKLTQQEKELHAALDRERSLSEAAQARQTALQKELDQCREQLARGASGGVSPSSRETTANILKGEREQAVIARAKLHAVTTKADKERAELATKLRVTEELLARETAAKEASVASLLAAQRNISANGNNTPNKRIMPIAYSSSNSGISISTSTEFTSPLVSRSASPQLPLPRGVSNTMGQQQQQQQQFQQRPAASLLSKSTQQHLTQLVGADMSSDDLLQRAQQRILLRREQTREAMEAHAMASLAQEIQSKMNTEQTY